MDGDNGGLISRVEVHEYFQGAVEEALSHQRIDVHGETVLYLANLLVGFVHSEQIYHHTPDGLMIRPLAQMYADAVEADTPVLRDRSLRKLGDVALFIAGLFSASLRRSLVGVDYYVAMGGNAYNSLATSGRGSRTCQALKQVFAELSERFIDFVDVLAEVGDRANLKGATDILQLYEVWLTTGSHRAAMQLRKMGIEPVAVAGLNH